MDADQTLLRLVDEEIARLQVARHGILERLKQNDTNQEVKEGNANEPNRIRGNGKTREEQLMDFLKRNGPSATKAILAGTGMPRGSLGFTLTRVSERIERLEDGKIALKK